MYLGPWGELVEHWDSGKDNGNYYSILGGSGFRVSGLGYAQHRLGFYLRRLSCGFLFCFALSPSPKADPSNESTVPASEKVSSGPDCRVRFRV